MKLLACYPINNEMTFQSALIGISHQTKAIGFNQIQSSKFVTAVSELARNIIKYAEQGKLELYLVHKLQKTGIKLIAIDNGTGIDDIDLAMKDSFSSSGTLGQGLPGTKRLVDEFAITSSENGTRVTITSWT